MRNLNLEAAIWTLFTSVEFYEAAARECESITDWFGTLAIARQVSNFGRNNQIYDKFRQRAHEFRHGANLAALGDYEYIWNMSDYIRGDVRGIMEQPLHSWLTDAEYREFEGVRIDRVLTYATEITRALNNAMVAADVFFDPDPDCLERRDDDDGFPGNDITETYQAHLDWYGDKLYLKLPEPLPEYVIDRSIGCKTGDEVPQTGVWYPATGLENHSLTFAIKGLRMPPVFRITKTIEELKREDKDAIITVPDTVAVATTWHLLIPTVRPAPAEEILQAKAGQPCPKAGAWQPLDPGVPQRIYAFGETMADLKSTYGYTVWRWIGDR